MSDVLKIKKNEKIKRDTCKNVMDEVLYFMKKNLYIICGGQKVDT